MTVSDILFSVSSRVSLQLIVRFLQSQNDLDFLNMAFIRPFIISSSFISTRPHRNFFCKHYGISIDYLLFVICKKSKLLFFGLFWKNKGMNLFCKIWKEKFTYTSLYLSIANVLRMFFIFQHVISSLSLAFRGFNGDVFQLHTRTHAHMHALIFICYSTGLRLRAKKLAVFIKHMHYKKSSSLAESNFSKTKVLSGNQALNKNPSNV